MSTVRILPTSAQIEQVATEFVDELHKIPLYDVASKRRLTSEYLRKVQDIILENICKLTDDEAKSVKAMVALNMLAGS